MTITKEELAAIRKRCNSATPGPWEATDGIYPYEIFGPDIDKDPEEMCPEAKFVGGDFHEKWDVVFVASARTDIPRLLDALEKAEAERDVLIDSMGSLGCNACPSPIFNECIAGTRNIKDCLNIFRTWAREQATRR